MGDLVKAADAAAARVSAWIDGAAGNPLAAKIAFAAAFLLTIILIARNIRTGEDVSTAPRERAFVGGATDPEPDGEQVEELTLIGTVANKVFLQFETIAYIALGLLLAATVVLGITGSAIAVLGTALGPANEDTLVYTIDRMLFVLMVVEILRTVRDSFRSGKLVSEPFLIVGLIASIRRVLVITLESSQASRAGAWTPAVQGPFNASMQELVVLGGLILVMVISIFLLRMSRRFRRR